MTSKRATRGTLRCTMIRATLLLLLCYLFTCCTHLAPRSSSSSSAAAACSGGVAWAQAVAEAAEGASGAPSDAPPTQAAPAAQLGPGEHLKHDNVHKLMSEQDLRRTFQVDSHDQVPEYEILKLTVNNDGSHLISPISDLGELTSTVTTKPATTKQQQQQQQQQTTTPPTTQTTTTPTRATTTTAAAAAAGAQLQPAPEEAPCHNNNKLLRETATTTNTSAIRHKRSSQQQAAQADQHKAGQRRRRRDTSANAKAAAASAGTRAHHLQEAADDERIIVMKLDKFGKHIRLRLKRNADFQQRIKGMKMFIAESTQGGRLKYTEIKSPPKQQQQAHQDKQPQQHPKEVDETGSSSVNSNVWNIGSTYHDEHNLAALLIDHDRLTGQLQVDGTIGNDFVIKPLPQATYEAVVSRQKQAAAAAATRDPLAGSSSAPVPANRSGAPTGGGEQQLQRAISHMHDDDPHDDDEMFLDEDEALELVHLMSAANGTRAPAASARLDQPGASSGWSSRAGQPLSKAQSERKWRKLRKLMAASGGSQPQHQVPKWTGEPQPLSSHHIVYRQRPSSEASSGEHRHSALSGNGAGLGSMDSLVGQLRADPAAAAQRLHLVRRDTRQPHHLNMIDEQDATDFQEDALGGQFDMEPAGSGRHAWSLVLPEEAAAKLNSSSSQQLVDAHDSYANASIRARFKRDTAQVRRKRQTPDTVWPEVLLVVDYDSFILHGGDSRDVKRYFVSFWNGVDLRYKLLVHPHIRISLAGMIVAKDRDATPYLERNRLRAPNADAVDAAGALTDMGKYLYREDRLPTYDLAVVITKLDMCRRRYEGGRCNRGTAGFAYVGGACVVNKRLEKVNSVAIIEDSGGFSGIIVAAHEVGHLLGCVHDGSPPPSYLGGPGATLCPWEEGFIMSDLRHTERGFRWSQCSVEQFKHFLNGETATCLYNYPHESQMLHRILPGTMLTLDEQCKRDRGTNACFKDARVCAQLFCFDSASGYCVSYRPAAEGSPCGEGQVCRNGKCVGEIENIIPDYTHQSQVIARRPQSVGALADNGLSASSTSTATSPPDSTGPKLAAAYAGQPVLSSRMDSSAYSVDAGSPLANAGGYHQSSYRAAGRVAARAASAKLMGATGQGHQSGALIGAHANNNNNNNNHNHKHHQHHHYGGQHHLLSATSSAPSYTGHGKLGAANYAPAVLSSRMDSYNSALDPQTLNSGHPAFQTGHSGASHTPAYRASRSSGSKLTSSLAAHQHTPTRRAEGPGSGAKHHTTTTTNHQHNQLHTPAAGALAPAYE